MQNYETLLTVMTDCGLHISRIQKSAAGCMVSLQDVPDSTYTETDLYKALKLSVLATLYSRSEQMEKYISVSGVREDIQARFQAKLDYVWHCIRRLEELDRDAKT